MKPGSQKYKDLPLDISGSTTFGRFAKMSSAQTFNMFTVDGWTIPFAGYKNIVPISNLGKGRAIYTSNRLNYMFAVISNVIYRFDDSLNYDIVGQLDTYNEDVFISENNATPGQVAFSDGLNIYIYDNVTTLVTKPTIDFTPGYLTFQNGRLISPNTANNQWRLSNINNGNVWSTLAASVGSIQTKPDRAVACVRFPGRGNLLLVLGENVTEQWYDVGLQLFPYQRSQSINIDYGCINPATIAENESIVCWVAQNEKSGPTIMYTNGGEIKAISTDGINYKLSTLIDPTNCYAYMFRQDGNLFYIVTWPTDNLTYAYHFNADKFYTLTDESGEYFNPRQVAFFNNQYYFVSNKDGNLYQIGSQFTSYDYGVVADGLTEVYAIPRRRICSSIALPDQSRFVAGYAGFTIEQGQFYFDPSSKDLRPRVDLSLSKDGGVNFGNRYAINMQPLGKRQNKLLWWRLGAANDLVCMFDFWGFERFVARDGILGVTS
jgi:hypothetical protein